MSDPPIRPNFLGSLLALLSGVVLIGSLLTLWQVWKRSGDPSPRLLARGVVTGGSMTPNVWGQHFAQPCGHCQTVNRLIAEQCSKNVSFNCPRCGATQTLLDAEFAQPRPADRVAIEDGELERWDLVALADSATSQKQAQLKRLVAFPHEALEIRDGDLFADGQRLQKSLFELRRLAIPVYEQPDSWSPTQPAETPEGKSDESSSQLRFNVNVVEDDHVMLTYTHQVYDYASASMQPSPMLDNYPENVGVRRQLQPVTDLLVNLEVTLKPDERCDFILKTPHGPAHLVVAEGIWEIRFAGQRERSRPAPTEEQTQVTLAYCDGRLLVEAGKYPAFQAEISPAPSAKPVADAVTYPGATPFHMVLTGDIVDPLKRVQSFSISRDIHYLAPGSLPRDWSESPPSSANPPAQPAVSTEGYFFLGDNVPVSLDSRNYGRILAKDLIGRVEVQQ